MTSSFGTIKFKLLSLQALLVVSIAVVNALVGYFIFSKYLSSAQQENLEAGTESMVIITSAFIRDYSYQLVSLSTAEAAKKYNQTHNPLVLQEHLSSHSARFPVISLINSKGIEEVKNVRGDVSFKFVDYSHNKFYQETRDDPNKVHVSSLRFEGLINDYVLDFGFHHTDYFDDDLGFILASARVSDLKDELKKVHGNDKSCYFIIDKKGNIIATNYPKPPFLNIHDIKDIDPLLNQAIESKKEYFFTSSYMAGRECVVSMLSLDAFSWKILNVVPQKTYYSSLQDLRNSNMTIAVIVLILGIALTFVIAKSIMNPIVKLEQTISKISSKQDISLRANVESKDEIGKLAESFNLMLQRIELSQQEITETKNYLNSIIKQMTDFMIVTDSNGTITIVNQNVLDSNDISEEELIGKKVHVLMKDQNGEPILGDAELKRILQLESIQQVEFEVYNWKGKRQFLSISAAILRNVQDEINGIVFIAQDISQRKIAEEKQFKLEQELHHVRKMEAIGTLAGGIAHDFNNILGAVIGYSELLQMRSRPKSQVYEYACQITQAGNRAKALTQQILTFSRKSDQEFKPIEIARVVREVVKLMRSALPATIEIKNEITSNSLVQGDPTQIHQVLMNLCTNAGHAMQKNGGILLIELQDFELQDTLTNDTIKLKPGPYSRLIVSDTGCGIPPEYLDRIFDPFFTTKKHGEGTGMGLSVVHGIVESMNGAIHVYSEPGKGTTFKLFLPLVERRTEPDKRSPNPMPEGIENILFIDDEISLVTVGRSQLQSLGYSVSTSCSSFEALNIFKDNPYGFDLIITDLTMPKMTGDELAEKMKLIRSDIPIILCTGFSAKITSENIHDFNFDALLMKPIILRELAEAVRTVIDERKDSNLRE